MRLPKPGSNGLAERNVTERGHATAFVDVDPTPRVYLYALGAHLSASGGGRMGIGDSGAMTTRIFVTHESNPPCNLHEFHREVCSCIRVVYET